MVPKVFTICRQLPLFAFVDWKLGHMQSTLHTSFECKVLLSADMVAFFIVKVSLNTCVLLFPSSTDTVYRNGKHCQFYLSFLHPCFQSGADVYGSGSTRECKNGVITCAPSSWIGPPLWKIPSCAPELVKES